MLLIVCRWLQTSKFIRVIRLSIIINPPLMHTRFRMGTPSHLADDVESPAHWMDSSQPGSLQPQPSTAKHSQVQPSTITSIQPHPTTAIPLFSAFPFPPRRARPQVVLPHHSAAALVAFFAAESGLRRTELLPPAPSHPARPLRALPTENMGSGHGWRGRARYSHCFWPGAATESCPTLARW